MSNIIPFNRSPASETNNEQSDPEPEPSDPEPPDMHLLPAIEHVSSIDLERPSQADIAAIVDVVTRITDTAAEEKIAKGERRVFRREASVTVPGMPEAVVDLNQYGFFDPTNDAAYDYYKRNPDSKVADITIRASRSALEETQGKGRLREIYSIEENSDGVLDLVLCTSSEEYGKHHLKTYSTVSRKDATTLVAMLESCQDD